MKMFLDEMKSRNFHLIIVVKVLQSFMYNYILNHMLNYIIFTLSIQIMYLYSHSVGFHLIECVELKKFRFLVPEKTNVISAVSTKPVIYLTTVLTLTEKKNTKPGHRRRQTKISYGKTMLYFML